MNEENISYYAVIPANVRYDAELTANAKLLYGEITALCNQKGYCWASNSYFANLYGVSRDTASRWVQSLIKRGYIRSEVLCEEGTKRIIERRIYLTTAIDKNADTYPQNNLYPIDKNADTLSAKSSIPIRKNVVENNTYNNTSNNTSNNISAKAVESDFEELWNMYPSKQGKSNALKKYKTLVKSGKVTKEQVADGIKRYNDYIRKAGIEKKYIKYGSTFFNGECWNDDFEVDKGGMVWDESDPTVF